MLLLNWCCCYVFIVLKRFSNDTILSFLQNQFWFVFVQTTLLEVRRKNIFGDLKTVHFCYNATLILIDL